MLFQVSALCNAVQDVNILVQRTVLDFIITSFPMHNKELLKADMIKLLFSVLNVLLRRDMSLNRRVYTWLLGGNSSQENLDATVTDQVNENIVTAHGLEYFDMHSFDILVSSVKIYLCNQDTSTKESVAKPFRLIRSLLDHPQIGGRILESLFLDCLRFAYTVYTGSSSTSIKICEDVSSVLFKVETTKIDESDELNKLIITDEHRQDVVKNLNLFLSSLEPQFIWEYFVELYIKSVTFVKKSETFSVDKINIQDISTLELTCLMEFLLNKVSVVSNLLQLFCNCFVINLMQVIVTFKVFFMLAFKVKWG